MTVKIADQTYTILDQAQTFWHENLFFPTFHWSTVLFSEKKKISKDIALGKAGDGKGNKIGSFL